MEEERLTAVPSTRRGRRDFFTLSEEIRISSREEREVLNIPGVSGFPAKRDIVTAGGPMKTPSAVPRHKSVWLWGGCMSAARGKTWRERVIHKFLPKREETISKTKKRGGDHVKKEKREKRTENRARNRIRAFLRTRNVPQTKILQFNNNKMRKCIY